MYENVYIRPLDGNDSESDTESDISFTSFLESSSKNDEDNVILCPDIITDYSILNFDVNIKIPYDEFSSRNYKIPLIEENGNVTLPYSEINFKYPYHSIYNDELKDKSSNEIEARKLYGNIRFPKGTEQDFSYSQLPRNFEEWYASLSKTQQKMYERDTHKNNKSQRKTDSYFYAMFSSNWKKEAIYRLTCSHRPWFERELDAVFDILKKTETIIMEIMDEQNLTVVKKQLIIKNGGYGGFARKIETRTGIQINRLFCSILENKPKYRHLKYRFYNAFNICGKYESMIKNKKMKKSKKKKMKKVTIDKKILEKQKIVEKPWFDNMFQIHENYVNSTVKKKKKKTIKKRKVIGSYQILMNRHYKSTEEMNNIGQKRNRFDPNDFTIFIPNQKKRKINDFLNDIDCHNSDVLLTETYSHNNSMVTELQIL